MKYTLVAALLLFTLLSNKSYAEVAEPEYDEISVFLNVNLLGGGEIPAVIRGDEIYLPIIDLFNFLKIKANYSSGIDSISGFFVNQKNTYFIERQNSRITYEGKVYQIKPLDFIKTESNLYLKSTDFTDIFGLECHFNFKNLSVQLKSKIELPAIREMRLEQMRANLGRLKGDFTADTVIKRRYPFLHFGAADWSLNATEQNNGSYSDRLNLGLGGVLAGGELNSTINYGNYQPFMEKQQFYLWRYANNEDNVVRQIMVGKISTSSISTLYNPVVGLQITNAPTYYRKSFGTYTLSNYTKPGWIVELYVNNTLIDYVKADASGFFTFHIPLIYGSTVVTLRYYGPYGEEQSTTKSISIPFNFLPAKEFEYKISSGMVENDNKSLFSQAKINYGLSNRITVGTGFEYFSALTKDPLMPFINTSIRISPNLLFTGEYIMGIRANGVLSYHTESNFQIDLNYSKYNVDQQAVKNNYTEERKISMSVPFKLFSISAFTKLIINQNIIQSPNYQSADPSQISIFPLNISNFTNAEWLISANYKGINANLTTLIYSMPGSSPYANTNLSISLLLPKGTSISPQIRYDYYLGKISSAKFILEKHISKHGVINLSVEQNFTNNANYCQFGYKHDFSFAHVGLSTYHTGNITSFSQSANGSIISESKSKYNDFNASANVGRGGIIFAPFLDINGNGIRDNNEPRVSGLNIHVNGGGIIKNRKDTTIIISGLEPYTNYFVEFNANSFENISWKLNKQKFSVAIDPNQLKYIEIPVSIVGEISGMVYMKDSGKVTSFGRIKVNIYNHDYVLVATVLSESDGFFNYLGLMPGSYIAKIDQAQMNNLKLTPSSAIPFVIKGKLEGDVVDNLKFIITNK